MRRVLLGQLIARVAAGHAQLLPHPVCCAACGGKLERQERPRPLVGLVEDEDFWWRVYGEALRRGLGTSAVRTSVVLCDGARWIWPRARAFLGLPGVEVVEVVDIYHAYGYLWTVGHALFGTGDGRAAAWVEPLKDQLYLHGAAPVLTALAALAPTTEEAVLALADAQTYFTRNAARMDYPQVVARHLPMGSGAVESACKGLVEARLKQAGRRWSVPGSHAIGSLRALHRSGRWAAFWQTQPWRQRARCASRPVPRAATQAACPAATASPPGPAEPPRVAAPAAAARSGARPKPSPAQRPLILPRSA